MQAEEHKRIKAELEGKNVSVIFDGTSQLGDALALILHFVSMDDKWKIERLVCLQLLMKSMTGEEYGISSERLLAAMHD